MAAEVLQKKYKKKFKCPTTLCACCSRPNKVHPGNFYKLADPFTYYCGLLYFGHFLF